MIRTSKHILKYQTDYKTTILDQIYFDYKNCLQYYVDLIVSEQLPLKKLMSSKDLPIYSNLVKSHWKAACYKQASGIVRANLKFQSNKRFKRYQEVYSYFKKRDRQTKFTDKKFGELNLKSIVNHIKIDIFNVSINLGPQLIDVNISNHFDEFIQINTPYLKKDTKNKRDLYENIKVPLNHHKHSNKYKKWNRKNTIQLKKINGNFYITLIYEKECPEIKSVGQSLGLDCGYKKLIACSDGTILGQELEQIYNKISNKKQGSKNFKQLLVERDKLINQFCNEINLTDINHLVVEDLKQVKHKSKGKIRKHFNNKLQRWSYVKTLDKLERLCEENGIQFTKVNPAYTSQTCSQCGTIDKTARNGESYQCKVCGIEMDADINTANNILHRGAGNFTDIIPLPKENLVKYLS